ncbi:MAG: riboflavin synthase [Deltaproteobacteria bacterium]|nr:riboflavin synthase [Deltaproteobacteria bacterium]
MFTGIVEGNGIIKKVESFRTHTRLHVECPFSLKGTRVGDSIAVDGCCLTATRLRAKTFSADISPETLRVTTLGRLKVGDRVNIERPLRMGDRLGGHIVQGHVDGVGELVKKKYVAAKPDAYWLLEVKVPKALRSYMVDKGSVTVDGISLTVNAAKQDRISLCIIPHTQEKTTLVEKSLGALLNLEADILLKYLEKMFKSRNKRR